MTPEEARQACIEKNKWVNDLKTPEGFTEVDVENTIKINDKVIFTTGTHIKGKTGVVESITTDGYNVRLDNSDLKFFSLISAKKDEVSLAERN